MPDVTAAASWTVKSHKSLAGQANKQWTNEYEFIKRNAEVLTYNDFKVASDFIVAFETAIHLSTMQVDRVVWSTWTPDSGVGVNDNFLVVNYGAAVKGQRVKDVNDEYVPLTHVARVDKSVVFGRSGKVFYRSILTEAMIMSPSQGEYEFNPDNPNYTDFLADFQAAETANMVEFYQEGESPFILSLINIQPPNTTVFRNVVDMVLKKPVVLKKDHRYFDRAPVVLP